MIGPLLAPEVDEAPSDVLAAVYVTAPAALADVFRRMAAEEPGSDVFVPTELLDLTADVLAYLADTRAVLGSPR